MWCCMMLNDVKVHAWWAVSVTRFISLAYFWGYKFTLLCDGDLLIHRIWRAQFLLWFERNHFKHQVPSVSLVNPRYLLKHCRPWLMANCNCGAFKRCSCILVCPEGIRRTNYILMQCNIPGKKRPQSDNRKSVKIVEFCRSHIYTRFKFSLKQTN
jgi:hypothetical protein